MNAALLADVLGIAVGATAGARVAFGVGAGVVGAGVVGDGVGAGVGEGVGAGVGEGVVHTGDVGWRGTLLAHALDPLGSGHRKTFFPPPMPQPLVYCVKSSVGM